VKRKKLVAAKSKIFDCDKTWIQELRWTWLVWWYLGKKAKNIAQWKEAAIGLTRKWKWGKAGWKGWWLTSSDSAICGGILSAPLSVKSGNNRADKRGNDQVKVHCATGRDIQTKRGWGGVQKIRLTFEKQTSNSEKPRKKKKKSFFASTEKIGTHALTIGCVLSENA